ncbi:Fanconi anemia core complex-associated protein 24 [Armadillidium vulgare]|nr:Fanconi anemia core complex-associated protein 24 [Armadillidium vulgare]
MLMETIGRDININYCDDLGESDFLASEEAAVIYLTEADILSDEMSFKRRLIKFCKAPKPIRKVVIAERTLLTKEIYVRLQRFVGIELGMSIIPVNTIEETARLLKQMVTCEAKRQSNPFRVLSKDNSPDDSILATLQTVPGFGDKKALLAIEKFSTLENIIKASEEELAEVVGAAAAKSAYKFFHSKF